MIRNQSTVVAGCGVLVALNFYACPVVAKPTAADTAMAAEKTKRSRTPVVTLAANAATVVAGDSVTLTWSSINATSCTASGAWSGSRPLTGSAVIAALQSDSTYSLTCTGKKGSAAQSVTVMVTAPPAPPAPPAPELTISQSAEQVVRGQNVVLTWTSQHATECTASGSWSGSRATNGQETIGPLTANGTFLLACTGPGGTRSTRADIEVVPPPLFTLGKVTNRPIAGAPALTTKWGQSQFADLDGDGRDDLLITGAYYPGEGDQPVARPGYVAFNKAEGFRAATADEFPVASLLSIHAREFAFVDFNEDGVKDLFVADHGYDAPPFPGFRNQLFLSQSGQPRWVDATAALPGDAGFTHSVTTGDVNGDGNLDIFVGNDSWKSLPYVLLGNGAGGFERKDALLPPIKSGLTACHLVDLDGDGLPELVTGMMHSFKVNQVYWNRAGSYASETPTFLAEPVGFGNDWGVMDIQSTDLNADGRQDLVLVYQGHVTHGGWQFQFLVNDGNRGFTDQTARYLPYPASVTSGTPSQAKPQTQVFFITPREVNGDGRTDFSVGCIAVGSQVAADDCPVVLLGQADGSFKPVTVGMLRAAGAQVGFFWAHYVATGPGPGGEITSYYMDNDARPVLNSVPISFAQ